MKSTARRYDKTVQWTDGTRPVIAKITCATHSLLVGEPADPTQIYHTLSKAGLKIGIIAPISPLDTRRGAARDIALLPHKIKGPATSTVAAALGHSRTSYNKGVTSRYTGLQLEETWSKWVLSTTEDPFGLESATLGNSYCDYVREQND